MFAQAPLVNVRIDGTRIDTVKFKIPTHIPGGKDNSIINTTKRLQNV